MQHTKVKKKSSNQEIQEEEEVEINHGRRDMKTEDQAEGNNRDKLTETAGRTQTVGVTGETHHGRHTINLQGNHREGCFRMKEETTKPQLKL